MVKKPQRIEVFKVLKNFRNFKENNVTIEIEELNTEAESKRRFSKIFNKQAKYQKMRTNKKNDYRNIKEYSALDIYLLFAYKLSENNAIDIFNNNLNSAPILNKVKDFSKTFSFDIPDAQKEYKTALIKIWEEASQDEKEFYTRLAVSVNQKVINCKNVKNIINNIKKDNIQKRIHTRRKKKQSNILSSLTHLENKYSPYNLFQKDFYTGEFQESNDFETETFTEMKKIHEDYLLRKLTVYTNKKLGSIWSCLKYKEKDFYSKKSLKILQNFQRISPVKIESDCATKTSLNEKDKLKSSNQKEIDNPENNNKEIENHNIGISPDFFEKNENIESKNFDKTIKNKENQKSAELEIKIENNLMHENTNINYYNINEIAKTNISNEFDKISNYHQNQLIFENKNTTEVNMLIKNVKIFGECKLKIRKINDDILEFSLLPFPHIEIYIKKYSYNDLTSNSFLSIYKNAEQILNNIFDIMKKDNIDIYYMESKDYILIEYGIFINSQTPRCQILLEYQNNENYKNHYIKQYRKLFREIYINN